MKKTVLIALLAVVLVHVGARPASAQAGIIRWIAKLSGPGPLKAYGYELYPFCFGKKSGLTRAGGDKAPTKTPREIDAAPFEPAFDLNCRSFSPNSPLLKIGFQGANFSGDNTLKYDASVPASLTDTVYGQIYAVTGDVSLSEGRIEAGGSTGRMYFTGTPAGAFSHPLHEMRGTIHIVPLFMKNLSNLSPLRRYKIDWLQYRISLNIVPGGLEDTDFGAIPGTFPRTEAEYEWHQTIVVNFGNLFGW